MNHTPGPWFVFPNRHCVGGPKSRVDGELEESAGIAMCGMRLRTEEEAAANAQLISVAPDMLVACQVSLRLLLDRLDCCDLIDEEKSHIDTLRDVIKKAKAK